MRIYEIQIPKAFVQKRCEQVCGPLVRHAGASHEISRRSHGSRFDGARGVVQDREHLSSFASREGRAHPGVALPREGSVVRLVSRDAPHDCTDVSMRGMRCLPMCDQRSEGFAHAALYGVLDGKVQKRALARQRDSGHSWNGSEPPRESIRGPNMPTLVALG